MNEPLSRWRAGRPWLKAIATMLVAALGVGGWQAAPTGPSGFLDRPGSPGYWDAGPAAAAAVPPGESGAGPADRVTARLAAPAPRRLRIAAIGVDAELIRLGIGGDGALAAPADFDRPGWYAAGTAPGQVGPAVIAGHVDSYTGPAVFARLHELVAGDRIEVVVAGGSVRFRVTGLAWYDKRAFPTDRVYGPTPDPQLRLITCGGGFDPALRSYTDNLVVYAAAA